MSDFLFAEIKDGSVHNIVSGIDSHSLGIISKMLPDSLVVSVTPETGTPVIGGEFVDGQFRPIKMYESWVWNSIAIRWEAPVEHPGGSVYWDDDSVNWIPIPAE
jgi:hypothetical protein